MTTANEIIERLPRVVWFGLLLACGLLLLVARLWWMQVAQHSRYGESGERQSLRTIRTPAARGRIFDRNGLCLVDNRPLYNLVLYLEELRTQSGRRGARKGKEMTMRLITEKLEAVSAQIRYPLAIHTNAIRRHIDQLMPLPLVIAENIPEDAVARFAARSNKIPGTDLQVSVLRVYPQGSLAAHVLGHVGRTAFPPDEELSQYYYYMPDMIGIEGMEAQFDDRLRGTAGGRSLSVDVAGYKHAEVGMRLAEPGKNICLTLDGRVQKIVEDAMGGQVGAAVVVDPRNGDILAMCSVPSYDPNQFSPRISEEMFTRLLTDPNKPFLNRATSAYEPGSTFKLITSLAGLESGKITTASESVCTGEFHLGRQIFHCWIHSKGGAHGRVDFFHAIKYSCNVFFYEHGIDIGGPAIVAMARQFHLGEKTGVPLGAYQYDESIHNYRLRDVESAGRLPQESLLRMKGHVANLSIGQGDVQATPLQMAYVAAALANGGTIWAPRLVDSFDSQDPTISTLQRKERLSPQIRGRLSVSPQNLTLVREAMLHVVEDEDGSGHKASVPGIRIAGKTGTAQFSKRDPVTGEMRPTGHHVWFVTFAPFEDPIYAMAIMVEEGDSGGTTCAPIAAQIYRKLFALEKDMEEQKVIGNRLTGNWTADSRTATANASPLPSNYQLPITNYASAHHVN